MNVYQIMTERILALLEKGTVPWHQPWNPASGMPRNLVSKRPYRGINVFLLCATGHSSPFWLTYRQAADLGGHVKKGEKGMPIVFWKVRQLAAATEEDPTDDSDAPSERRKRMFLIRYYTVFNFEQTEGIPAPKIETELRAFNPIRECERIVEHMTDPPKITHGHFLASYKIGRDEVAMPARESFKTPEYYYGTLFHELGHATGHEKRLARKGIVQMCPFGSTNYSREELVAEMTATFLCGAAGIANQTVENSAAYIAGWKRSLEEDPKAVVIAAAQAQKAADWILNRKPAIETEQDAA